MKRFLSAFVLVFALGFSQQAEAIVVATFQDPAAGNDDNFPSLFVFSGPGSATGSLVGTTLAQSAEGVGADVNLVYLNALGGVLANFTFPTLEFEETDAVGNVYDTNANGTVGDTGVINFYDATTNAYLMSITFDFAYASLAGVGGATQSLINFNIIDIDIPGWTLGDPQSFAFAFSNSDGIPEVVVNGGSTEINASFTASADSAVPDTPVPEPGSMLLLGSGLFGLAASARRRLARKKQQ